MDRNVSKRDAANVEEKIRIMRGQRVILDRDLAEIYGVETKILNKALARNKRKFPSDFAFRLNKQEFARLRFQNGTSNNESGMRFQTGTASRRNIRYLPYAFTEHGAIMVANILRSRQAEEMSVFVVRAFVKMREQLLSRAELEARLSQIENVLLAHDDSIRELYRQIRPLLLPPPDPPSKPIGFGVREHRAIYRTKRKKKL